MQHNLQRERWAQLGFRRFDCTEPADMTATAASNSTCAQGLRKPPPERRAAQALLTHAQISALLHGSGWRTVRFSSLKSKGLLK